MVSHSVDSVVKGVTDFVVGAGGRMLTVVELLPGVFRVSLSKDQGSFSDDTTLVVFGCAETGKKCSSAIVEFQGNLETMP